MMDNPIQTDPTRPSTLDLHAPFTRGIEESASVLEIRLALHFYWQHHDRDHWKLYLLPVGRA